MNKNVEKKSWEEFRSIGLIWFVNMILHTFGWAIAYEVDAEGKITEVYPARVKFRGFPESTTRRGYIKLSEYLKENIDDIASEAKE